MTRRRGALWTAPALALALCLFATNALAGDPYLRWYTVVTPHFRVTYHGGLEKQAQRVANLAEAANTHLGPELGWRPSEVTEIMLSDVTDSANGSATALPYNAVRLFVTAPDDMSPLGEYDDWLSELVTHEYTHILHVDNISGIPKLLNTLLGKTYAPNQVQPRWVLEGLAVAIETEHTGGGRLRSSQFDMILRADVIQKRLAGLDEMSHPARRWPSGNLWYLYGGAFIAWIADVYGPETFASVASDYGSNIIPWGINRSIRRATGRTYTELYRAWKKSLEQRYSTQIAKVEERGLREGTQITHRGRNAGAPRWVPECARKGSREELIYYVDDGDTTAGFWRQPLASRAKADEGDAEIVTRSSGHNVSFEPSCSFVFDSVAPSKRFYYFGDLFRQPRGTSSERGIGKTRDRLTTGIRAREPDISPDGRHVVYVTNHAGTSTLRIADVTSEGEIVKKRALVPSALYEQAFTPRFSHDGKRVAYSVWTYGGYRDVRVVDVSSGRFWEVTHDTALDQQPSWSPDDRTLYFVSDRSGIANVYAKDLVKDELHQVTNVKTGAYFPEASPDGKTLAYVGYTSYGFDLFTMPIEKDRFLEPPPPAGPRPSPHPDPGDVHWPVEPYNPLATLRPHNYEIDYGPGTFGQTVKVSTSGFDIVGHHAFRATLLTAFEEGEPSGSLVYAYRRLPFDFSLSAFRSAAPRKGYRYGDQEPIFTETFTGVSTGVAYTYPGEYDAHTLALYYTLGEFDSKLPVGQLGDPYAEVTRVPHRGFLGLLSLGYAYSNVDATIYGISAERGFSVAASLDYAGHETASDDTLTALSARVTGYVPMPWLNHHVLALSAGAAAAVGSYPRRGLYYTGGFVDGKPDWNKPWDVLDAYSNGVQQGSFVLRGYEPVQFIGSQYNLVNAEYRFPIAYPDAGIATLPIFLRSVSGTLFADYGGAFDRIDLEDPLDEYHLGVGAELWFDLVLGYHVSANIRLGYARGTDSEAISGGQTYVVVASAF